MSNHIRYHCTTVFQIAEFKHLKLRFVLVFVATHFNISNSNTRETYTAEFSSTSELKVLAHPTYHATYFSLSDHRIHVQLQTHLFYIPCIFALHLPLGVLWHGNSLKPSGIICNPPGDLVIVSFMQRQYFHEGESRTRSGNVYFHCSTRCVLLRQPAFDPLRHCVVTDPITSLLTPVHYQYIEQDLGLRL